MQEHEAIETLFKVVGAEDIGNLNGSIISDDERIMRGELPFTHESLLDTLYSNLTAGLHMYYESLTDEYTYSLEGRKYGGRNKLFPRKVEDGYLTINVVNSTEDTTVENILINKHEEVENNIAIGGATVSNTGDTFRITNQGLNEVKLGNNLLFNRSIEQIRRKLSTVEYFQFKPTVMRNGDCKAILDRYNSKGVKHLYSILCEGEVTREQTFIYQRVILAFNLEEIGLTELRLKANWLDEKLISETLTPRERLTYLLQQKVLTDVVDKLVDEHHNDSNVSYYVPQVAVEILPEVVGNVMNPISSSLGVVQRGGHSGLIAALDVVGGKALFKGNREHIERICGESRTIATIEMRDLFDKIARSSFLKSTTVKSSGRSYVLYTNDFSCDEYFNVFTGVVIPIVDNTKVKENYIVELDQSGTLIREIPIAAFRENGIYPVNHNKPIVLMHTDSLSTEAVLIGSEGNLTASIKDNEWSSKQATQVIGNQGLHLKYVLKHRKISTLNLSVPSDSQYSFL